MPTKGAATRRKILQTARQLFNARGFKAVSVSELVHAVGMQKGSIYFHFSDKDELTRAVFAAAAEDFTGFLDQALAGENPAAALQHLFASVMDYHLAAGFVGGCLFGNAALEMSDSDPEFARLVESVFNDWKRKLAGVVARAQQLGQLRNDLPCDGLATQIIATIEGGIMMARLKKEELPLRQSLSTLGIMLGM